MSGRKLYSILKPLITCLVLFFRVFPKKIREVFYEISMFIPTKLGVFIRLIIVKSLVECGDNIYIATNVRIKNFTGLTLGSNISIHENCFIDAIGCIRISDNVSIAHNCSIVSFEHSWTNSLIAIKYNEILMRPINIDSDVWVGCGARLLGGTSISNRVIVAAGAVVKGHLKSKKIYAGMPAKCIKDL